MLGNLRLKLIIGFVVVVLLGFGFSFAYIKGSDSRISSLERQQIQNTIALQAQKEAADAAAHDRELLNTISARIDSAFSSASNSIISLRNNLRSQNLGSNAHTAPSETEQTLNRISQETARCNEIVTGANVTPDDANNNVCPELVRGHHE